MSLPDYSAIVRTVAFVLSVDVIQIILGLNMADFFQQHEGRKGLVNDNKAPPLDFSFKNLASLESLKTEKPRKGVKHYRKSEEGRYVCSSLRLNNNMLTDINGIHSIVIEILDTPEKLTWLDISFNRLTSLPPELALLTSLKIVYLHGNHLVDLHDILKPLKSLEGLYGLTLHGNPVEERKNYRSKVISALPHLRTLDFNNVTPGDRKKLEALKKKH